MRYGNIKISRFEGGQKVFKPDYYLNSGKKAISDLLERGVKNETLLQLSSKLYQGGIFKRVFVENELNALKYLTFSDVSRAAPMETANNISKVYTPWIEEMTLRKHQILVSCAGTGSCGRTAIVDESYAGHIGSQEIIRIETDKIPIGYLYAYLSSPLLYNYIQSMTYGAAIPRISPEELGKLPVLLPPSKNQTEIHKLVIEATELRVNASAMLKSAIAIMSAKLPRLKLKKIYKSTISTRIKYSARLEASYDTNAVEEFYRELKSKKINVSSIKDLSKEVFTPGIFKRVRTESCAGVPYLSGSDLLDRQPNFQNFLSKKMKNIDNYILKEGWLAIQDAGTIGYLTYVHSFLDGVAATNNLVRIVPKDESNFNPYIYCFLKTETGKSLLKMMEYGGVQKHIDNTHVSNLSIPLFKDVFDDITNNVTCAMTMLGSACTLEKKAVSAVEKEIELWQS